MGRGAYEVRQTLRTYNGEVTIASEIGLGATMILCTPLACKGEE